MQIFRDLDEFSLTTASMTKWVRAVQAVRVAPEHAEGAMHSIGDSLTYLRTRRRYAHDDFVGHRRYLEVLAALDSPVDIVIAAKCQLEHVEPYSDLTDRERLTGSGQEMTLRPGQLLITDIDEAVRYPTSSRTPHVVLHVSVEGATFPNK